MSPWFSLLYAWLQTPPGPEQAPAIRNPLIRERVVAAVDRELAKKGFARVSPDATPDLLVSVHGWAQSRVEVTNYGYSYGGAYAYGPYRPMPVSAGVDVRSYTDGTMLLDFVDAKAKKLVWRGTASDTVKENATPEEREKNLNDAMAKPFEYAPGFAHL